MATFEEHISAYLDGELEGEAKRAFLQELENDPKNRLLLDEYRRLNSAVKQNAHSLTPPLAVQRALAERIPVLQQMNPRLAPLSGAETMAPTAAPTAVPTAGTTTGSGLLHAGASAVVKTIKVIGIVGTVAIGTWVGTMQFSGDENDSRASLDKAARTELSRPAIVPDEPPEDAALEDAPPEDVALEDAAINNDRAGNVMEAQRATVQASIPSRTSSRQDTRGAQEASTGSIAAGTLANQTTAAQRSVDATESQNRNSAETKENRYDAEPSVNRGAATGKEIEAEPEPKPLGPNVLTTPATPESEITQGMSVHETALVLVPPQETVVPFKAPEPRLIAFTPEPTPVMDELNPDMRESSVFSGYINAGIDPRFIFSGLGNSTSKKLDRFNINAQLRIADHWRLGLEAGMAPFRRGTLTAEKLENGALPGVTMYRWTVGERSASQWWGRIQGEWVMNPGDRVTFQFAGSAGTVFGSSLTPIVSAGIAGELELFEPVLLRVGGYYTLAWMKCETSDFTPVQGASGFLYDGKSYGWNMSSDFDLRIGFGFRLW